MEEVEAARRALARATNARQKAWDRLKLAVIAEQKARGTSEVQLSVRAGVHRTTVRNWLAEDRGER